MYLHLIHLANKRKASFKLSITTTSPNETFTLPLISGGSFNFTTNWGDGTADSTITAYNSSSRIHTYTSAGTYTISMWGTCTRFRFDDSGDKLKLKKVLDFVDMGFTALNFSGCSNLTSISSNMKKLTHLTDATNLFYNCSSLTSIPTGIFDGSTGITSFYYTFYHCTSLTSIPTDLFRYNTSSSLYSFSGTFYGCTGITSIPTDLFRYNIKVENFSDTFNSCSGLTSLPTDLFRYNTKVTDFNYCFSSCSALTSIPTDLFRYNTEVLSFFATFSYCTNLTSLPDDSFKYNTKVDTFSCAFNTTGLTSLPTDLFRYNTAVTTFEEIFFKCYSLATIPTDLFRYNTAVTNFSGIFIECTSLASVPIALFKYNILANNFNMTFFRCNKLQLNTQIFWETGERDTRFHDISVNFGQCFSRTTFTGTQGTAPDLWNCDFGTGTPTKTDCFDGAGNSTTSLTNYTDIPTDWK